MEKMMITNPDQVRTFTLAGKAHLTLRSTKTGNRFTYRVKKSQDGRVFFVSVLADSNNEGFYSFLGTIKTDGRYYPSPKSRVAGEAPSARAWDWFFRHLNENVIPETLEVWHEGKCGRCGRKLTVPESIESGFGPECINYICEGV